MSRASAAVRFPDGTLKYAMYCGTTDRIWPRLFDSLNDAWDAYLDTKLGLTQWYDTFFPSGLPSDQDAEKVEICAGYGHGMVWTGKATRGFIVSELSTFDIDGVLPGVPEWVIW